MDVERELPWWQKKRVELLELAKQYPNAYVYDADSVRMAAESLLNMPSLGRVLYAVKANFNADLLKILAETGTDFECVSPGEVDTCLGHDHQEIRRQLGIRSELGGIISG